MKPAATLIVLSLLTGCATIPGPAPLVDLKGVDPAKYEADTAECMEYVKLEGDKQLGGHQVWQTMMPEAANAVLKRCLAGRGYSVLR